MEDNEDAASSHAASIEAGAVAFFLKPVENRQPPASVSMALAKLETLRPGL